MPSKSVKQRNLIFAIRNKYKDKKNTPKKWKWVWGDEWLKVESYIMNFKSFITN